MKDQTLAMEFGRRLEELCKRNGVSLSRVARATGIPKATLHGWTTGRKTANPAQMKKLAAFFKMPIHLLLFGEPDPFYTEREHALTEIFHGDLRVTIHRIERVTRFIGKDKNVNSTTEINQANQRT